MTSLFPETDKAAKIYRKIQIRNAAVVTARVAVVTAAIVGVAYASHKIKEAHKANN